MAENENLNLNITANADGAVAGTSRVLELLAEMIASQERLSTTGVAAGDAVAEGMSTAAAATATATEAQNILGASIGKVEIATNAAARAFSAMGIETGAATARVGAMTEALGALGATAGPLLGIGAALIGVGAAFNFLKDGIDTAEKMQDVLTSLGVAVRNQGDSWEKTRPQVEAWAAALEAATTFSKSEAVKALDDLVTAGVREADAQKIVTIATDVAAGSHKSLIDVVDALKHAEAGRGMALIQLDENLKKVIQSHGHLSEALAILSRDFQGQAAAALDTYEGKQKHLHDVLESLGMEIGEKLIPTLTIATELFIGMADSAEKNADKWANSWGGAIRSVIGDFIRLGKVAQDMNVILGASPGDLALAMLPAFHPSEKSKAINAALGDLWGGGGPAAPKGITPVYGGAVDFGTGGPGAARAAAASAGPTGIPELDEILKQALAAGEKAHEQFLEGWRKHATDTLENDPAFGRTTAGRSSAVPYEFDPGTSGAIKTTDQFAEAQKSLANTLKGLSDEDARYAEAVKGAGSETAKASAELEYHRHVTDNARAAIAAINTVIDQEQAAHSRLTALLPEQTRAASEADAAWKSYGKSLDGLAPPSKEQLQHLKDLDEAHKRADAAVNKTSEAISRLNDDLAKNNDELQKQGKNLKSLEDYAAAWRDQDRKIIESLDDKFRKETEVFYQEQAARQQQLTDEATTYKMSLAQQIAYYEQQYAAAVQAHGRMSSEAKAYYDKVLNLELDSDKQRVDQHDVFIKEMQTKEETFLDDILLKHKSLRDELKTVFTDIETAFVKMVERMLIEGPILGQLDKQISESLPWPGRRVARFRNRSGRRRYLPHVGGIRCRLRVRVARRVSRDARRAIGCLGLAD